MTWYIATVERHRERAFASEVEAMPGCVAWVPEEFRFQPPRGKLPARVKKPGVIVAKLAFIQAPLAAYGDLLAIKYVEAIWCNSASVPFCVPDTEIQRFRDEVDKHNGRLQRYFQIIKAGKTARKPKRYRGFDELDRWLAESMNKFQG